MFYLQTVSAKIFEEQKSYSKPYIIIATDFKINIHKTDDSQYGSDIFNHMINIHHLIGSPVTCMNARSSPSQLAVGLGSCGGAIDPYRVCFLNLSLILRTKKILGTLLIDFNGALPVFSIFYNVCLTSLQLGVVVDRMVVDFTTICTISAHHHLSCEFKSLSVTCGRSVVFSGYSSFLH